MFKRIRPLTDDSLTNAYRLGRLRRSHARERLTEEEQVDFDRGVKDRERLAKRNSRKDVLTSIAAFFAAAFMGIVVVIGWILITAAPFIVVLLAAKILFF